MARSYRRTPIFGWNRSSSDKYYKKQFHRKMRSKSRQVLAHYNDDEDVLPAENECYDPWGSNKEGIGYHNPYDYLYRDSYPYNLFSSFVSLKDGKWIKRVFELDEEFCRKYIEDNKKFFKKMMRK
jgi:hypothetical protein